jgi:hypothetical protein
MPTIAPWLQPPNFVGAMSAGAAAGLGVRKANQEATEAADRLELAYNQLAANERRAAAATKAKLDLANASLALRGQQMDAMQAYHQGQLAAREENMNRLATQFGERENRMKDQFGQTMDARQAAQDSIMDRFAQRMDNADLNRKDREAAAKAIQDRFERRQAMLEQQAAQGVGRLAPADYFNAQADANELRDTQKQIAAIDKEGGPKRGHLGLTEGTTKLYPALKAKEAELRQKLASYQTPRQKAAADLTGPTDDEEAMMEGGPAGTEVNDQSQPAQYTWDPQTRRIKPIQ